MRTAWLGAGNPWVLHSEAEHQAARMMHRRVSSAMIGVELTEVARAGPPDDNPQQELAVRAIVRAVHAGLSDLLSALEEAMDDYVQRHDARAPQKGGGSCGRH